MDIAIAILALGGLYVISNEQKKKEKLKRNIDKENFLNYTNNTINKERIPRNPNVVKKQEKNYPLTNNNSIRDDDLNYYQTENETTEKYLNQNLYEVKENAGVNVGRNIPEIYSITNEKTEQEKFRHTNMTHFYGSKIRGENYTDESSKMLLDNMIGLGSQDFTKKEQGALFKPENNYQYPFGMPNNSDYLQSRQQVSMINNNVLPFEQQRVGPGLNKGFTVEPTDAGYNASLEGREKWMPYTVDQLRTKNNPKQEYNLTGLEGPAHGIADQRGVIGKVEKYRPDAFYENTPDRWLKTTGSFKGNQSNQDFIMKETFRNKEEEPYGGGALNSNNGGYIRGHTEEPKRTETEVKDMYGSIYAKGQSNEINYNRNQSYSVRGTNREHNHKKQKEISQSGNIFSSSMGYVFAPLKEMIRPTKKEELIQNVRVHSGLKSIVSNSYIVNPNDTARTTIKETTLYEPRSYVGNQQYSNDYVNNITVEPTKRENMDISNFSGVASGVGSNYGPYNDTMYLNQTNNDKKATVDFTPAGVNPQFNNNINVNIKKNDNDIQYFNRHLAPNNVVSMPPSVETYGKFSSPNHYDDSISFNRIEPSIVNQFKTNPYTYSIIE